MRRKYTGRSCQYGSARSALNTLIRCYRNTIWLKCFFEKIVFSKPKKLFRETLEAQIRVLGKENPDTLASQASLARVLISEGQYREAESTARQAFEIQLRVLGPEHPDSLNTLQYLGTALVYEKHYGEAKKLFTDTIDKLSKTQASTVSMAWYGFACVAAASNHRDDAVPVFGGEAIKRGYEDIDHIRVDSDLKSIRTDRRFQALLTDAAKPAPAAGVDGTVNSNNQ